LTEASELPLRRAWTVTWVILSPPSYTPEALLGRQYALESSAVLVVDPQGAVRIESGVRLQILFGWGSLKIGFGRILGWGCGGSPTVACHWGLVQRRVAPGFVNVYFYMYCM
jgi:hypothetical protein